MEFLLELLLEIVFEGVVDGVVDGMESKKVPFPLRVLLAVVWLALLGGLAALFIWIAAKSGSLLVWILLMGILAGLIFLFVWKLLRAFRGRRR